MKVILDTDKKPSQYLGIMPTSWRRLTALRRNLAVKMWKSKLLRATLTRFGRSAWQIPIGMS